LFIVKSGKVEIRLGNRLIDTWSVLSIFGEMALRSLAAQRHCGGADRHDTPHVPVSEK
jgi:hypothetical protein